MPALQAEPSAAPPKPACHGVLRVRRQLARFVLQESRFHTGNPQGNEAVTITQFGRVELDPNRVPVPASVPRSTEPSFQDRLDTTNKRAEEPRRPERTRREEPAPAAVGDPQRPTRTRPPENGERAGVNRSQPLPYRGSQEEAQDGLPRSLETALPIRLHQGEAATTRSSGQPAPLVGVVRGQLSPSTASSPQLSGQPIPTDVQAGAAVAQRAGAQRTGQALANAAVESATTPKESVRSSRTQSGYRMLNKPAVQMAEAARDSVFRQVALRMNGEGGEMRILLDPPELGKLDLQMVVEKGGTVHLSLIAERPELALILEKHMAELRQTLQAQGLSIGNTDVRARDQGQEEQNSNERSPRGEQRDEELGMTATAFGRGGYITAEGLDFWV